jgi:hypothetical protein
MEGKNMEPKYLLVEGRFFDQVHFYFELVREEYVGDSIFTTVQVIKE